MKFFLFISFRTTGSYLRNHNRINLLIAYHNLANFICSTRSIHKESKIGKIPIFRKKIIRSDFLRFICFKRLTNFLDFITFILIRFLIVVIEIKALVLI